MAPRVATGFLVAALIRRIEEEGGTAMVLARGDATAGALLIQLAERGAPGPLLERRPGPKGYEWTEAGPVDPIGQGDYIRRRRKSDPDLWAIELDHARAREIAMGIVGYSGFRAF